MEIRNTVKLFFIAMFTAQVVSYVYRPGKRSADSVATRQCLLGQIVKLLDDMRKLESLAEIGDIQTLVERANAMLYHQTLRKIKKKRTSKGNVPADSSKKKSLFGPYSSMSAVLDGTEKPRLSKLINAGEKSIYKKGGEKSCGKPFYQIKRSDRLQGQTALMAIWTSNNEK